MRKKGYKKIVALALCAAMLLGNLNGISFVNAQTKAVQGGIEGQNLIRNPEFDEVNVWEFAGGGYGSNNGYPKGTSHFYLDGGADNYVKQSVKIPADGIYEASMWAAAGGSGSKFGVSTEDGTVLKETDISGSTYAQYELKDMELAKGDVVEVYVTGSSNGWVNGDQFVLACKTQTGEADIPAEEETDYIFEGNMIVNPSFAEGTGWVFSSAGYASNNGHYGSGDRHFYINVQSGKMIQRVFVPYTGYYKASIWVASAGTGAVFGANNLTADIHETTELATNTAYTEYTMEIWANRGDEIEIYVTGGSNWVNGDDISLEYNLSRFENMAADPTVQTENVWKADGKKVSQGIYIPQAGPYYAEVTLEDAEGAVVSFAGTKSDIVNGSQTVRVEAADLKVADLVQLAVDGKAVIKNAVVKFDLAKIPNEAPTVSEVTVTGDPTGGLVISGSYKFMDADGHTEGNSVYQWLIADTADGTYTALEGETNKNLTVKEEWEDQYLKFRVTPVDQYEKAGEPTLSNAVGPVDVNLITDPGFESDAVGWSGISISNKDAYAGLVRGIVNANATATQMITVEKSAYYNFAAYVRCEGEGEGKISVQDEAGNELESVSVLPTGGEWAEVTMSGIALEEGQKAKLVLAGASDVSYDIDALSLKHDRKAGIPSFSNVKTFTTSPSAFSVKIDNAEKVIEAQYLYGTDLSKITISEVTVSEGAAVSVKAGDVFNLTENVKFTVTGSDGSVNEWTISAIEKEKRVVMESSNQYLEDTFNWAANKLDQFVMTGTEDGPINVPQASGETADYIPSYWAGYYDRTAFYTRDFVHQATGAQIAGLAEENYSMFSAFAKECTEARQWYTVWALNFDGSVYTMDYYHDDLFVREVPAQFELVEKAYKQYLWSGDERYIWDETLWSFYTNVMTNYVDTHDENGNGVAQEVGTGIFYGSCTYNERGNQVIEAGDAIGSQYQATLAYAGMLKARGEEEAAEEWYQKAADLKAYFNDDWSIAEEMDSEYVSSWGPNGEKYSDFAKETSWFIPLKMVSEAGERNDAYIDFILENLGDGIGTTSTAPSNIEAYTYIPDMLFLYNRSDDAWKWMKYITSIKDEPHERPIQGTNGDYPEISFTFVSQVIEGMMGVEPDAGEGFVATVPRLPKEVPDATANYMQIGDYELNLTHTGNTESTLTNSADKAITWEARFYGDYEYIMIGGNVVKAQQKELNGELVSYASAEVAAGASMTAKVVSKEFADNTNAAKEVEEQIAALGTITLESITEVEAARQAYEALSEEAKALVKNLDVLEQAEEKITQLENNQGQKPEDKPLSPVTGDLTPIFMWIIVAFTMAVSAVYTVFKKRNR